jgi:hypothetical protein
MEYVRINSVAEADFDEVVRSAGGSRISQEGSADYLFNEAIIELKLVMEEGFEKTERQRKLANLFRQAQPNLPVVHIDPKRLNPVESMGYYRIVEVPIKNACKKASKQLQVTAARFNPPPVRVLVILNVGYTLLSADEFKDVCFKCVRNDTSGIDWVVCGGIYFFSDKFDNYVISRFEDLAINLRSQFQSRDLLLQAWGAFVQQLVTNAIRSKDPFSDGRMPVLDLMFELDGVRYVKLAPRMPKSTFWPSGRHPRENTSGIETCPAVARTFPSLTEREWRLFKKVMPLNRRLKSTYQQWRKSYPNENGDDFEPLKPIVCIEVNFEDFARWVQKPKKNWQFGDLGKFSTELFHQQVMLLLADAKEKEHTMIVPLDYIHLIVNEVGNDKANDYSSIYHVFNVPGFERDELIVENQRVFFEHAIALAAAYAIKHKLSSVLYTKRRIG